MSEDTKYHKQDEPPNIRGFSAFDLDRLEAELTAVTEQRDKLHGALEMVRDADEDCHKDGFPTIPKTARHRIDMAIAAVEGGRP
jgi:hypothetical protein